MGGLVTISAVSAISLLIAAKPQVGDPGRVTYSHRLSTNFGTVPLDAVALTFDPGQKEIYTLGDGPIRIFNSAGMEVFTLSEDPDVGTIVSLAVLENGDLLTLARREGHLSLVRCNFRGELIRVIEPRGVPPEFGELPGALWYRAGKVYLGDRIGMRVLVLDEHGAYLNSYDLAARAGIADQRTQTGISGLNVDGQGNILFTISPLFSAYLMTPSGEVRAFGTRGSGPGKFNVVGGIASDDSGRLYVADKAKSAIVAFDRDFNFIQEFGYRGRGPGNLVGPEALAVGEGMLFVSQHARQGVSVFKVGAESEARSIVQ